MLDRQRLRTFLLGGAAGALAALLLAPRSGRELRGTLADRAGEARERGRETYFEAQERLRERLSEAREGGSYGTGVRDHEASDPDPGGEPVNSGPNWTPLRDASRDVPEEGPDAEVLRERIRATRARLRSRLRPGEPGATGERRGSDDDR